MAMYTVIINESYGEYKTHRSSHRAEDAFEAVEKAVAKAYGNSASFRGQRIGGGWSGQIWKPCRTGGLTSVTSMIWIEAERKTAGAPLVEHRADWDSVDWTLTNAEISRILGVTRQAVAAQRKRLHPV